jgi:ATP-dependent DNA helicase RecG
MKRDVTPGKQIFLFGQLENADLGVVFKVEDHELVQDTQGDEVHVNRIVPVYPLTEGIQDRWLRSLLARVLPRSVASLPDPLPVVIREQKRYPTFSDAVKQYHFPSSWAERDRARERLAFDEFFFLELALAVSRQEREHGIRGFSSTPQRHLLTPFKKSLGYEFTKAQVHAINEIFQDMERPMPMNRLLQGDVGSGKTVVALSAALLAVENGYQCAFLAPTEILAGQHAISFAKFLAEIPVRWALLTGSTPAPEREKILKKLAKGDIDLLVGTHAILNEDVKFKQLGLAIIDEQHRFGVRQRAKLVNKSTTAVFSEGVLVEKTHPDILIMTATPIPRTLALTLYGDLDVSILRESPAGRLPIKTAFSSEDAALRKISAAVKQGRQAYIVFPLVEESELLGKKTGKNVKAATKEFERLTQKFPGHSLGLLHGQMKAEEKKKVMEAFRRNEIQILVATPVIEVGIDIPNATIIAIVNPERFGLAQLHQLRGRVGRGAHPSECFLIMEDGAEPSVRLSIFCELSDGFRLAEEDLKLRGPGEFVGEAQHGLPFFRVGDLLKDELLIAQARDTAKDLVEGRVSLTMKEYTELNRTLQNRFGHKIQLTRVG